MGANLPPNALALLKQRYLLKDDRGRVRETPEQMFRRVARAVAKAEGRNAGRFGKEFFGMMSRLEFLPNSPTMFNAGTKLGQLSACFVLPINDSLVSIFDAVKHTALIEQSGGGVGLSFSRIRPKGSMVKSSRGQASGPVSFMRVFDTVTGVINAGGKRRGAMMGVLDVGHPDIMDFITSKEGYDVLSNFNISVAVTDSFMEGVRKGNRKVWDAIVEGAWKGGDPGLLFMDEINRGNPTRKLGKVETTNPCVPSHTWIMTGGGPRLVDDIINNSVGIGVNGCSYQTAGFFRTGRKEVFKITTKEGLEVEATASHPFLKAEKITRYKTYPKWTALGELKRGDRLVLSEHNGNRWDGDLSKDDGYLLGLLFGDGTMTKRNAILYSWSTSKGDEGVRKAVMDIAKKIRHRRDFIGWCYNKRTKRYSLSLAYIDGLIRRLGVGRKIINGPIERESYDFYVGFIGGLFDADGSVQGDQRKGVSIRLSQSNVPNLKAVQRMLLRLGIMSKLYQNRRPGGLKRLPDRRGGKKDYKIKAQHELVISNRGVLKFLNLIGFRNIKKKERFDTLVKGYRRTINKDMFVATIESIVPLGIKEVFDINVPVAHCFDANGFLVHNCGEAVLHPYESCNLGSINLTRMVSGGKVDWERLRKTARLAVRFLDDVIDVNRYPISQIEAMTKANRRIGLGVMGFADMLIMLGIPYDSEEALRTAGELMRFITEESHRMSEELAKEKGPFRNMAKSSWKRPMRNATTTTIAPTGSISIIAGVSSGIEPLFAVSYVRSVLGGRKMAETNRLFSEMAKSRGFHSKKLMSEVARKGTARGVKGIPKDVQRLFATALEISPEWHVRMQAAFQKHTDNAVSKTVNFPKGASRSDIDRVFMLAHRLRCKGITAYRYGSRKEQVLTCGECE